MYGANILHSGKLLPISQEDLMESIYTAGQKKIIMLRELGVMVMFMLEVLLEEFSFPFRPENM